MKRRAPEPSPSMNGPPIVLKKYGNRRLYDTTDSRYVTLPEVEQMLQRGKDVQVVDAKSGDDLTKEILVQIILDKENARDMLPTGFLKQVVRLSASPLKQSFTRALQDSLDTFQNGQRAVADAQRSFLQQVPYSAWNPFAAFAGPPPAAPAAPSADAAELERLRSEMSQTQALLRQLIVQQQMSSATAPVSAPVSAPVREPEARIATRKPKRTRAAARN